MKPRTRVVVIASILLCLVIPVSGVSAAPRRPNIVLIIADDMGFSDLGCYGSEISTPHVDSLAERGVRFTQFYNCGRCCPTRASLLTGLYPHQAGVGYMEPTNKYNRPIRHLPEYQGHLNDRCMTIAEVLGAAGYQTFMAGKWHVGSAEGQRPLDRGFDRFFGLYGGASNFFRPRKGQVVDQDEPFWPLPDDYYTTDYFAKYAAKFIAEADDDRPFFLYLAFTAPHWPLHAWPEDIAKYRDKYRIGWDALRARRFAAQKRLGLFSQQTQLTARHKDSYDWSVADQSDMDLRMAVYAAMIDRMDQGVGQVLQALRDSGRESNTLILVLSDNGGCAEPLGKDKPNAKPPGPADSFTGYFLPWANASNTPFRLFKHWVHEGGIATPLTRVVLALLAVSLQLLGSAPGASPVVSEILTSTGVHGGLVVVLGCADPALLASLRRDHAFVVVGLDVHTDNIAEAQAYLCERSLFGPVTVMRWDGETLPFANNLVNLIVMGDADGAIPDEEMLRVLVPGGAAVTVSPVSTEMATRLKKPVPATLDDWSHVFHNASNNAWSRDTVVGPPKALQWWAGPYSERSHNWVNGTAALVTSGGRLFYLHDEGPAAVMPHRDGGMNWAHKPGKIPEFPETWKLVARDAFNGVILWKRGLEGFGNLEFEAIGSQPTSWNCWSSPLSLNRRMVASPTRVYVTLAYRGGLSALDAKTGETVWEYKPEGHVDEVILGEDRIFLRVRGEIPRKLDFPFSREAKKLRWARSYGPEDYTKYVEQQRPEIVAALDAHTGRELWTVRSRHVATETLCALDGKVCFVDYSDVVCLDAASGREVWRKAGEKRLSHSRTYSRSGMAGMLFLWDGKAYFVGGDGTHCLDLADGEEIWHGERVAYGGGFGHPTGLRVVNGVLYTDNGSRWDAATGEQLGPLVEELALGRTHGRCHRGVATDRYLLGIRFGVEFLDIEAGRMVSDHRWLRSSCALGYVPANGLLYHTPDPCACWIGARMRGYHAFAAKTPEVDYDRVDGEASLERGPAYAEQDQASEYPTPKSGDWPTYRHDALRSGQASTVVPIALEPLWSVDLDSPYAPAVYGYGAVRGLTPPVIAAGRVFISRKDANEIVCLDADTGGVAWRYATPCFVDTPPTLASCKPDTRKRAPETSVCLFGCADGYIYCLRAVDGVLVWRFRAGPAERLILHDGRPASKWPAHGAVLVQEGHVCCTAGQSSFLDGGIHVCKLDVTTGEMLAHARLEGPHYGLYERNPFYEVTTNQYNRVEKTPKGYFPSYCDIEGARSDILVSDGVDLHMGQTRITPDLQTSSSLVEAAAGKLTGRRWLRPMNGFLDDTYFHRVGWHYSDQYHGGGNAAGAASAGKLVVFDDELAYGIQWEGEARGRYPNHLIGKGTLLVADRLETSSTQEGFNVIRDADPTWAVDVPQVVRAMVLTQPLDPDGHKTLFVAGPLEQAEGQEPLAPYRGEAAGTLWAVSAGDGGKLGEWTLKGQPVFDGMAAANGRLYLALTDGQVICLGKKD